MNKEIENKILELWKSVDVSEGNIQKELKHEVFNQIASAFAIGKYYYMIFNFKLLDFEYIDSSINNLLGIQPEQFSIKRLMEDLHPEDIPMLHEKEEITKEFIFSKIPKEEITSYKVVYLLRLRDINGEYKTILHQSRAINVSEDGKILQSLIVHSDVTFLNIPFNENVSFISKELPCYYGTERNGKYNIESKKKISIFSNRELEIIKLISEGKSSKEIAEILFVSPNTVNYHKKNILKKSGCKNTAQFVAQCIKMELFKVKCRQETKLPAGGSESKNQLANNKTQII